MTYTTNPLQEIPDSNYDPLEYMLSYARQELGESKDNCTNSIGEDSELYDNCGSDVESIIGVRHFNLVLHTLFIITPK